MPDELKLREELWDQCRPWTEGLSRLFDAVQEEVEQQYGLLSTDGRRANEGFRRLSPFQKVAYMHLKQMRNDSEEDRGPKFSSVQWLGLMRQLDETGVNLDAELSGLPQQVIAVLRRKGKKLSTWQEACQPNLRVITEDGKYHSLRSLVKKAVHNAARSAGTLLGNPS